MSLIQITDIDEEDGFYRNKEDDLIGAFIIATYITNSLIKNYYYIDGKVVRESDRYSYKKGEGISFYAVQYREVTAEEMIKELRYTNVGIDEYLL